MNLLPESCPECSSLLWTRAGTARPDSRTGSGADRARRETGLARHLANRHPHLIPGWVPGCERCGELDAALRQAQEQGLLGAGAHQAGAEHRALHLLTRS
ncbi:hypothetical protein AB0F18_01635 [Streptomyces sp. NPDC029216]|uniref:hypothetical protein n=1 Tax=Streptomyces sp. NPDC029216 TaxID=3154701 RepID=UPI0034016270